MERLSHRREISDRDLDVLTNAHGPSTGLQKQNKTPNNKQLITLERSVFTGKSRSPSDSFPERRRSRLASVVFDV